MDDILRALGVYTSRDLMRDYISGPRDFIPSGYFIRGNGTQTGYRADVNTRKYYRRLERGRNHQEYQE